MLKHSFFSVLVEYTVLFAFYLVLHFTESIFRDRNLADKKHSCLICVSHADGCCRYLDITVLSTVRRSLQISIKLYL